MNKAVTRTEGRLRGFGYSDVMKTLLDLMVFNAGIFILGLTAIPAHLVAVSVALGFSFWVNNRFMFGPSLQRRFSQVVLLLLVTAFGLYVLQTAVIYLLLYVWTWPLEMLYAAVTLLNPGVYISEAFIFANTAKIIATLAGALSNYLLYKNLEFSEQRLEIIDRLGDWLAGHKDAVILAVILSAAAAARLWRLHIIPPGLHPDEAAGGLNALAILGGDLGLFFDSYEGLFLLLQTAGAAIMGNSVLAIRIVPALIGIAAVLATYMAAKEWFSVRVALLAAFFMSLSPWAIQVSRAGFSAGMLVLFLPLLMLVFARALKTNGAHWWVATGILFGLGFYTHVSYYVLLLVALAVFFFTKRRHKQQLSHLRQPLVIVLLSALLVLIPLLLSVFTGPAQFIDRSSEFDIFKSESVQAGFTEVLPKAAVKTAAMFHFAGDSDYRHNLAGEAQLNLLVGILMVLGLVLAVKRWRDVRYFALLALFAAFTIPSILAGSEAPDALLAAGTIPVINILAAIGLVELFVRWKGVFPHNPLAHNFALLVIISACFMASTYNYQRYFVAWVNTPEVYEAHNEQLYELAQHLIAGPAGREYVVEVDEYHDMPVRYLTEGRRSYLRLDPAQGEDFELAGDDRLLVPVLPAAEEVVTDGLNCETHLSPVRKGVVLFKECHR